MSIVVQATLTEVRAAINDDPSLQEIAPSLKLCESTLSPPRRSLEELPSVVTIVDFLATSLATNIAYDIGKKIVFDVLARRFGKNKIKEEANSPSDSSRPDDPKAP